MDVDYERSAKRVGRDVLAAELAEEALWESEGYQRPEQERATVRAHETGTEPAEEER